MLELNFPLSWKLQTYSQYWCGGKKKKSPERAIANHQGGNYEADYYEALQMLSN